MISPEGCASILWRSSEQAQEAAEALRLTAQDLLRLGVIDDVIPEPLGGAHRGGDSTIEAVGDILESAIRDLLRESGPQLKQHRREKFLEMGQRGLG